MESVFTSSTQSSTASLSFVQQVHDIYLNKGEHTEAKHYLELVCRVMIEKLPLAEALQFIQLSMHLVKNEHEEQGEEEEGVAQREPLLSPPAIVSLISDICEICSVKELHTVFDQLESAGLRDHLLHIVRGASGHKTELILMAMTKKLLVRLSNTGNMSNTRLCGRVSHFLCFYLSLSHKGLVNLSGEVNEFQPITIDEQEHQQQKEDKEEVDEEEMTKENQSAEVEEMDQEMEAGMEKQSEILDHAFYQRFWKLQDAFRHPNRIVADEKEMKHTTDTVEEVLEVFSQHTMMEGKRDSLTDNTNSMPSPSLPVEGFFAPQYLTSWKLLHLEFKDVQFRRQFITQVLLVLNGMKNDVQFEKLPGSLQDAIEGIKFKAMGFLPEKYQRQLKVLFEREKHWTRWKKGNCKEVIERPAQKLSAADDQKMPTTNSMMLVSMGNEQLLDVWDRGSSKAETLLRDPYFMQAPSLEDHLARYSEQRSTSRKISDEDLLSNNRIYVWRAFRLIAMNRGEQMSLMTRTKTFDEFFHAYQTATSSKLKKQQVREEMTEEESQKGKEETMQDAEENQVVPEDKEKEEMQDEEKQVSDDEKQGQEKDDQEMRVVNDDETQVQQQKEEEKDNVEKQEEEMQDEGKQTKDDEAQVQQHEVKENESAEKQEDKAEEVSEEKQVQEQEEEEEKKSVEEQEEEKRNSERKRGWNEIEPESPMESTRQGFSRRRVSRHIKKRRF